MINERIFLTKGAQRMDKRVIINTTLGIFFLGSLWGFVEASMGDWLYSHEIAYSSLYLTTIAIAILASSKIFYPHRWTGTVIGAIALCFKLVNVPFFACHLLAILLLGFGFDIAYECVTRLYSGKYRLPLIGLFSAYAGRALFAVIITYVVRYRFWTEPGLPKVIDYIFITGTVSALLGSVAAPVGSHLAGMLREFSWPKMHPRFTVAAVLMTTAGIWMIQMAL